MLAVQQNSDVVMLQRQRKPINLRVSYTPELRGHLPEALSFVMQKLDFQSAEAVDIEQFTAYIPEMMHDEEGNSLTLLLQMLEQNSEVSKIIFHTDDCLRDYHKYIIAGVEFISRPQYGPEGLKVNFMGYGDQVYTLLEERDYTEQN